VLGGEHVRVVARDHTRPVLAHSQVGLEVRGKAACAALTSPPDDRVHFWRPCRVWCRSGLEGQQEAILTGIAGTCEGER
jgi:hypothetical protein